MSLNILSSPPALAASLACLALLASGCRPAPETTTQPPGETINPERAADMLHAVMEADREMYTTHVINRLVNDQHVRLAGADGGAPEPLQPSERWKSELGTLPLPAQMFRMGAEKVEEHDSGFHYALLSEWPINKQNKAKTDAEKTGL